MRPIYWGLVLTFAGICSAVLLGLVYDIVFLEKYPYGGIADTSFNSTIMLMSLLSTTLCTTLLGLQCPSAYH